MDLYLSGNWWKLISSAGSLSVAVSVLSKTRFWIVPRCKQAANKSSSYTCLTFESKLTELQRLLGNSFKYYFPIRFWTFPFLQDKPVKQRPSVLVGRQIKFWRVQLPQRQSSQLPESLDVVTFVTCSPAPSPHYWALLHSNHTPEQSLRPLLRV